MFRIREVTGGILAVLFNVIAWAGMLLLLSFQFQLILGETPLEAGIRILPFEIAFLAVGPLSGTLSDKFGHSKFTLSGLLLGTISLLLFSTTNSSTPYSYFSFFMILMGVATGLFLAPNLRSVMAALPGQRRGIGSALVSPFLKRGSNCQSELCRFCNVVDCSLRPFDRTNIRLKPSGHNIASKSNLHGEHQEYLRCLGYREWNRDFAFNLPAQ